MENQKFEIVSTQSNIDWVGKKVTGAHNGTIAVKEGEFIEIYVAASLEVCEERDTKGLYKKARAGEIKNFTGISDPYEAPVNPELTVDTGSQTLDESAQVVLNYLEEKGVIEKA